MEKLSNEALEIKYYPNEYVMVVDMMRTLVIGKPNTCYKYWELIKNNFDEFTNYEDIYNLCSNSKILV